MAFGSLIGMDNAEKSIALLASEQLLPIIFKATEAPTLEQEIKNYALFSSVSSYWHDLLADTQTVGQFLRLLANRYHKTPYQIGFQYQDKFHPFKKWIAEKNVVKDESVKGADELIKAIDEPDAKQLKELLTAHRLNPDSRDPSNPHSATPLLYAVTRNNIQATQMLLDHGASPNTPIASTGWTPLIMAVKTNNEEITKRLLQMRANPNIATTGSGSTPLMVAADQQNQTIVSLLLKYGADKSIRNKHNLTALDIARKKGDPKVIELLQQTNQKEPTNEE